MTTVTSARGLLLIWTSFLTGLFLAYCLCSAARFVNARSQAVLPPARPVIVEKIYERRAPGAQPANERNQGG